MSACEPPARPRPRGRRGPGWRAAPLLLALACATATARAPTGADPPVGIRVPDSLLSRTSMPEASGLVFSPALSRYLVVSDDTGDKDRGTWHAPWLFAMDERGDLDPTFVTIQGIDRLNDAEAICAGPAGSFFLATSHAPNRKGHDKAERRQLLHLAHTGRDLKILDRLDLGPLAQVEGMPPGPVDIEALSYRADALYLGLKAPLTADGAARILVIKDLARALAAGAPTPSQISRFAEVRLEVPGADGRPVTQGISDMTFLPDGSLVLLANSPKRAPPDGGGAMWWLPAGAAPRLVRRFPGLKPEGVTLAADGRTLLLVFDCDRRQPLWLRQPLPALAEQDARRKR